jgi:hypothetical protein
MSKEFKPEFEMCVCGHFGGVSPNTHNGHQTDCQIGHGECNNCPCEQFTWIGYVDSTGFPTS